MVELAMIIMQLMIALFVSFLGTTLDLFSTWAGITFFNAYETRPFGNIPLLAYAWNLGLALIFFQLSEWMPTKVTSNQTFIFYLGKILMILIIILPYIGFINNVVVISNQ